MSDNDWVEGYRKAVAKLLGQEGDFVRLAAYRQEYSWDTEGDYSETRTTYGWREYDGHVQKCGVKDWDTGSLRERTLSQFQGTFADNSSEVGLEMRATCNCGKYTDKWVRYHGSLGTALRVVLGG